jgi:methylated-DNA-[protein]-cysteine S-methyltransferase
MGETVVAGGDLSILQMNDHRAGRILKMHDESLQVSLFSTAIGWMALAGRAMQVQSLVIAYPSEQAAYEHWENSFGSQFSAQQPTVRDWFPEARLALADYVAGGAVNLAEIDCDLSDRSPFEQRVLEAVRAIPCGEVRTYGEIAEQVGHPLAARAVGGVMARNRVPLLIPCHRVVGTKGKLTGFNAPRGILLKRELLEMEQNSLLARPLLAVD